MILIIIFVVLIFLQSLISGRLEKTIITTPILFACVGVIAHLCLSELHEMEFDFEVWLHIAELGLVLLLFTDASRTELHILKNIRNLPGRLLSTGMLLTILFGGICALVLFGEFSIWEAGILAAILAPTDAGLGQVIVNSPHVPMKIRQALNVEAGLNDGLSVPFLLFFIALATATRIGERASLMGFIVEQLGYGVVVGAGIGLAGGWLLGLAQRRKWMAHSWQQLGVVTLPLLCFVVSEAVGASMFIAAFVAGLFVQVRFKEASRHSVEFAEEWGQLFNLAVFFLFGLMIVREWPNFEWRNWLYAVASLTVVRMIPVAISLIGTRLSRATSLFMGWFGPRGLASIVLGMVYLEQQTQLPAENTIRLTVMATVFLSIFAHGFSALPGIKLYARKIKSLPPGAAELDANP